MWRNPTPLPEYIITEAKYGSSRLGETADGKQMSDDWILGSDRLERATGNRQQAADIEDVMARGQVEKQLHHIDENGKITVYKLDEAGNVIK